MPAELRFISFEVLAPGNANCLVITHGPTRSVLGETVVVDPPPETIDILPASLRLLLRWSQPPQGTVHVQVSYVAEVLGQRHAAWFMVPPESFAEGRIYAEFEVLDTDWPEVYSGRAKFREPEQRLMFEIDRRTSPKLLRHAADIPDADKLFRESTIIPFICELDQRLERRWNNAPIPALRDRAYTAYISAIFDSAIRAVFPRPVYADLGDIFCRFAAGHLRRLVSVDRGLPERVDIVVTEPDSYFVFLFAEFAIAALEHGIDTELWNSLLPWLVKMQRLYVNRIAYTSSLRTFGFPGDALSEVEFDRLSREFPSHSMNRCELELLMARNLHERSERISR
jgi:hypothetical protein